MGGTYVIARELREEDIQPMRGKEWSNTVVLRILRNEKYCGDLVQKKTYTPDFLSHEKKYNRGQEEFVILTSHHEPIISREMFEKANRILDARTASQEHQAKHSNRYPLSGKIKCGRCGHSYVARYKTRKDGSRYKAWCCYFAQKNGKTDGCSFESIRNEDAIHILSLVMKSLKLHETKLAEHLISLIRSVIYGSDSKQRTEKQSVIENRQKKLLDLYVSGDLAKEEYLSLHKTYEAEIQKLAEYGRQKPFLQAEQEQRMTSIEAAVRDLLSGVEREDVLYRELLQKMVVIDREHTDVYLHFLPKKWSFITCPSQSKKQGAFPMHQ